MLGLHLHDQNEKHLNVSNLCNSKLFLSDCPWILYFPESLIFLGCSQHPTPPDGQDWAWVDKGRRLDVEENAKGYQKNSVHENSNVESIHTTLT